MSTETNGNPPSATKRKKNRDKMSHGNSVNGFDLNLSNCNNFPMNSTPYNTSIQDMTTYYSFLNYSNPSEPTSLPIFPINCPTYSYPPPHMNFNYMRTNMKNVPVPNIPQNNGESVEYLSLPVVNVDAGDDTCKRSFSDPGLPDESDDSSSFDDCLVRKLTYQVNLLRENNKRLSKEVMELRVEMNMLKQQQNVRHYDREYEPGMLADIIREVRDAARVREDALLARVKHIIEEKQLSMNQLHLMATRNKNCERISKLEEQMKLLNITGQRSEDQLSTSTNATEEGASTARQVLELEREALELRRELQDARAKKEESDKKIAQCILLKYSDRSPTTVTVMALKEEVVRLDKKLSLVLKRNENSASDNSEDGKTTSIESLSVITSATSVSSISQGLPRVTLSGPVTDL